jgi:hypothetical protein
MLDKLPLELLDHVLDLLPPSSTDQGARERTDTLLSCCLVSKRLHERSLPILWRNVRVNSEEQYCELFKRVEFEFSDDVKALVRSFSAEDEGNDDVLFPLEDAVYLARKFRGLKALKVTGTGTVDLQELATSLPSELLSFCHPFPR